MNYAECLVQLTELGHELRGVKFDLGTTKRVLDALGGPHQKYPAALIAGTNGKGSTSAMLASILNCAGIRAGLYTSPHLVRANERIRVAGREIPDEEFAAIFSEVHSAANGLMANGGLTRPPSYFEYLTSMAFLHFARVKVDFAVLEVGMGGRLDATNVSEPQVSVVTNVALDHEKFLGGTVAAIAREKAGVIRPGRPVISGCEDDAARQAVQRRAEEAGAELVDIPRSVRISNVRDRRGRFVFDMELAGERHAGLAPALSGRFQIKNAAAAVAAAQALRRQGFRIPPGAVEEGVSSVEWPGRLEIIHHQPLVLLDGAHNPAAARELAAYVREELKGRRVRLVYASMRDKAIDEISEALFPLASEIYLTTPPVARAASALEILSRARIHPERIVIEPDPARAFDEALEACSEDDAVLVAGSLFLVGEIERLRREGALALQRGPGYAVTAKGCLTTRQQA